MIRHLKRYFAIRSYLRRLSHDLVRRFGRRASYKVEHVTQAAQRGKFSMAFLAYAHAAFCNREDFDAHYQPMGVACNYQGLRQTIARRYFAGQPDFDAESIISKFRSTGRSSAGFYESNIGENDGGN